MDIEIITGEKLQQLSDIYLGTPDDFAYNNLINIQKLKHVNIEKLVDYSACPRGSDLHVHVHPVVRPGTHFIIDYTVNLYKSCNQTFFKLHIQTLINFSFAIFAFCFLFLARFHEKF